MSDAPRLDLEADIQLGEVVVTDRDPDDFDDRGPGRDDGEDSEEAAAAEAGVRAMRRPELGSLAAGLAVALLGLLLLLQEEGTIDLEPGWLGALLPPARAAPWSRAASAPARTDRPDQNPGVSNGRTPWLRRDSANAMLGGVCAGIARALRIDPIITRVGFVVLTVGTSGIAAVGYLLAWALIPATAEGRAAASGAAGGAAGAAGGSPPGSPCWR